jgi:hypothetical protein
LSATTFCRPCNWRGAKYKASAPLHEWKQIEEYEVLIACKSDEEKAPEKTRADIASIEKSFQEVDKNLAPLNAEKLRDEEEIRCALFARCVATDDPRLRGK